MEIDLVGHVTNSPGRCPGLQVARPFGAKDCRPEVTLCRAVSINPHVMTKAWYTNAHRIALQIQVRVNCRGSYDRFERWY